MKQKKQTHHSKPHANDYAAKQRAVRQAYIQWKGCEKTMDIKDYLTEPEILCQLAEEAAELAQAALKLRRVLDGTNPTPVTEEDAQAHLLEEIADINNCLFYIINDAESYEKIAEYQREKAQRWLTRLEARG
ncbi:MAG: hypothetical protein LUC87_00535 [Clostridiales bacterium]|nr:hypothetical protein [Clostridiales bacterium]